MKDEQVYLFRPGEERRLLARMQFGLHRDGKCGAIFTYPIPGYPWRHNVVKTDSWQIDGELTESIFQEVAQLPAQCPDSCLPHEVLWADHTEKANAITRDRDTDTLCFTIGIIGAEGEFRVQYSMRETEQALQESTLLRTVKELTALLEDHKPWKCSEQTHAEATSETARSAASEASDA